MDGNPCFPRPIVVCTCESIGNPIHWTIHQTFSALVTSLRQCRDTPICASRCIGFVILRAFIQLECPSYKTTNPLYLLPPAQKKTCFASLGLAHSGMRVGFFSSAAISELMKDPEQLPTDITAEVYCLCPPKSIPDLH